MPVRHVPACAQVVREHGLGLACTWDPPGISGNTFGNGAAPAGACEPGEEAPFTTWKFRPEGVSQGIIDFIWCALLARHRCWENLPLTCPLPTLAQPAKRSAHQGPCSLWYAWQVLAGALALAATVAHAKRGGHRRGGPAMRAVFVRSPGTLCCI